MSNQPDHPETAHPATAPIPPVLPGHRAANLYQHAAIAVLVLGLCITTLAWWETHNSEQRRLAQEFSAQTQTIRDRVRERLHEHEVMLRGALGMIAAAGRIPTRNEWLLYVESLRLPSEGTGVLGFGLILDMSAKKLPTDSASAIPNGVPVTFSGGQSVTAITYIEPANQENTNMLGYDLATHSALLSAMNKARDTGRAAISDYINQGELPQTRANFMLFVPVYAPGREANTENERRSALLGYAYSPFLAKDLFEGVLNAVATDQRMFEVDVFDAYPETEKNAPLFSTRSSNTSALIAEHALDFPGKTWLMRFSSRSEFMIAHRSHASRLVAVGGILLSLLIFGLIWAVSRQRDWATARAVEMTRKLRENRSMLEAITESAHDAILSASPDGHITYLNPAALKMFGLPDLEDGKLRLTDLIVGTEGQAALLTDACVNRVTKCVGKKSDGGIFPMELSIAAWSTGAGTALNAIVRDISERKFAESRMEAENRIALILAESGAQNAKLLEVMRTLATIYGWDCSAFWQISGDRTHLQCTAAWTGDHEELNTFYAEVTAMPIGTGSGNAGIARRTWETDAPCWIPDVQSCGGALRAAAFTRAGIRCGIAFPINAGKEKIGVVELFSRQTLQPKDSLMSALASFGVQIAQFCKRKQAELELWKTATHDALTGLPNRSMFNESLARAFARTRRQHGRIAVMFVDLDRFKTINDTLGHEAGDAMLIGIAQRLRKVTREVDLVARLGGDEFVLLIEQFNGCDELGHIADRILRELDAPIDCAGHQLHATASIGISISPEDGCEAAVLLKCADIAMYRAKEEGRNQFRFYSSEMSAHTVEKLALENNLHEAITRKEFLLHYQPKIELNSDRVLGVEALIRWMSPVRGMVPPGDFIPLAEDSGLILQIGRWALQTACRQGRAWQLEGLPHMRIAVNLSAYQLTPDLPAEVSAALAEAGLDAEWLEIEVTESMVMRNPEQSAQILDSLRALGVHISMDDFGCGYSSLGALKRLPLDTLKVDRSLVSDLPDDAGDNAICRAIVAMAHALKLRVVAEGVETEAQREFLRSIGCDEVQGYLLSRPLPAADAAAYIRSVDVRRLRLVHSAR